MPDTFLIAGDFHIGRTSSDCPPSVDGSARGAWNRFVDKALDLQPDAVLLTGDLVDDDRLLIPAVEALRTGLHRLRDAEIPVVAIAGNHDPKVMRRYAEQYPDDAVFLGLDRRAFATYELPNGWSIVGWSYTEARENRVPWETFPTDLPDRCLGMLHGDLDTRGAYASFTRTELGERRVALWALGHIHKPAIFENVPAIYPGSPQALDFGETGPHGAVLAAWDRGKWTFTQVPISNVYFDDLRIELQPEHDPEMLLAEKLDQFRREHPNVYGQIRVTWTGEHDIRRLQQLQLDSENPRIDTIRYQVRPPIDLQVIAGQRNSRGLAARLLLALEGKEAFPADLEELRTKLLTSPVPSIASGRDLTAEERRDLLMESLREWAASEAS
jgi:DNA repair exonuclease SbcCD nuclease subunit